MLNQILRRLECAEVLVALANCLVLPAAVLTLCHQDGDLRAELGQLERTCSSQPWPPPVVYIVLYKRLR